MSQQIKHFTLIREAVSAAGVGTAESVRLYTQSVVDSFLQRGALNEFLTSAVSNAEYLFRQGKRLGIDEATLVGALNRLGDEMGLPPYGKTSALEVRLLRATVAHALPEIFSNGSAELNEETLEAPAEQSLSPAEALYLTGTLVRQKLCNPQFQVTEEELRERNEKFRTVSRDQIQDRTTRNGIRSIPETERGRVIRTSFQRYFTDSNGSDAAVAAVGALLNQAGIS